MKTQAAHRLTPQEYSALVDAAKLRAMQLRREAIHDFWSSLSRGVKFVSDAIRRSVFQARSEPPSKA